MHEGLARAFGTAVWTDDEVAGLAERLRVPAGRRRASGCPAPRRTQPAVGRAYDALAALAHPVQVQRVHADFHLGQTLRAIAGWKIIDFEGEPGTHYDSRAGYDSPWRDVAGMLRSVDYAAKHLIVGGHPGPQEQFRAQEWGERNRQAFLSGYRAGARRGRSRPRPCCSPPTNSTRRSTKWSTRRTCVRTGSRFPCRHWSVWHDHTRSRPVRRPPRPSTGGPKPVPDEELDRLVGGAHYNPHAILGAHPYQGKVTVRALRPLAESVEVVTRDGSVPMTHERAGVFVAVLDREHRAGLPARRAPTPVASRSARTTATGSCRPSARSTCTCSARAGTSGCGTSSGRTRGATPPTTSGGITGTAFTVWAPNARGRARRRRPQPLERRAEPDAQPRHHRASGSSSSPVSATDRCTSSRFSAPTASGGDKSDPMAQATQVPPESASKVFTSALHLVRRRLDVRPGRHARRTPRR